MPEKLLLLSNEWWKDSILKEKVKHYHRKAFKEIHDMLKYRQIIVLTGLRRVGKTTILYQIINELLKKEDSKHILYFNFDDKSIEPIDILKEFGNITNTNWEKEKCYIFFDEIQKVKDWSSKLKFLYDNLPHLKFFISGSASLMIEKEALHNLTGRFFLKEIPPLSLKEFAELYYNKKITNIRLFRSELEKIFPLYIQKPFPEIVKWKDERSINEYIKELIIDKIIGVDIPEMFEVNIHLLKSLTDLFLSNPGMILNATEMAKDYKVHKNTLQDHLFYLQFAKIIKVCSNYRPSIKAESRKLKKIYPYHISLSFPFYPELEKGKITESLIAEFFTNYWREKEKEIDFIRRNPLTPIEVKSKNKFNKYDLKNIAYFVNKYNVNEAWLIYNGESKNKKINNKKLILINLVEFLFKSDRIN